MSRDTPWPPQVGEPLPRRELAFGVHDKLTGYSLDVAHADGGPKARGFKTILGITIEDIDYLEGALLTGVLAMPVGSIRERPWGLNCVVMVPVRGRGQQSARVVSVKTIWQIVDDLAPRLINAFPEP